MKRSCIDAARRDPLADLRDLMTGYSLSRAEVARLAGVSAKTVESWFASSGAGNYRRIQQRSVDLVRLSVQAERAAASVSKPKTRKR